MLSKEITKFCPNCGNELRGMGVYCVYCGMELQTRRLPEQKASMRMETKKFPQEQEYAKTFDRLVALIIDNIIISIFVGIITLAITGPFWWPFAFGDSIIWNSLYFPFAILYFFLTETYNGQTVGKRAMKLKTVDEATLQSPLPKQHFINNLTKAMGPLFLIDIFVGYISNDGNPKNQIRYTQQLSKTVVIKLPE